MAVSKVILNGNTLMDTTQKTVTAASMLNGITALKNDGTGITGSIASKTSSDLTASGDTITAPAGYYASSASKAVSSGSATTPATTITANPTISVSSGGLITANVSASQSVTPSVSAGYVSSGTAGTVTVSGSNTQQLTAQAAQTITPTTTDQTIASGKFLTGAQTIKGDANLVAGNIKKDVSIFGVTGAYEGGGGGGITVTNYSILSADTIDFSGSDADLFSVSSGGMSIATVPIYVEDFSAYYQFACFGAENGSACFGSCDGGVPIFAEFVIFGSSLTMGAVMVADGTPLTASLDVNNQMTVYSV